MPQRPSRRDLLLGGVAATILMPQIANAENRSEKPEDLQADKLLADARKAQANNIAARMAFDLPENSEPCFTFIPVPRQVRKR